MEQPDQEGLAGGEGAAHKMSQEGQLVEAPDGAAGAAPAAADFHEALKRVVKSCVVLKVTQARSFDTEASSSSYATGFIVDAKRGLILTNRHVVTPGPITAEAIFLNREEVPVKPLYYDPIHDFGFLRFDPAKVQFMEVLEVPLRPEAAAVGLEVRVVGNDSGEKISILAGTLARLDRDAPVYGKKGYNDFNTFYLQAASGTKGGSSGSPVINRRGEAVALNAGGRNKAASAFYLPLERVVRALKLLQGCHEPGAGPGAWHAPAIPRGDLQATFLFKGYDEVRRLGLSRGAEAAVRAAASAQAGGAGEEGSTGMLVVEAVVPGGPSDGALEAGDVLVALEGRIVVHFQDMEDLLDARVGVAVAVDVERGGRLIRTSIQVQDLHAVTPASFLEVSGAILHGLSLQQARNNSAACGQVYVAETGYIFSRASVPKHAILSHLAGIPIPDLTAFARVLRAQQHGSRVPVQYYVFGERHRRKTGILDIDLTWYGPPRYWTRNDAEGTWDIQEDWPPPGAAAAPCLHANAPALNAQGAAVESDSSSCNAEPDDGTSEDADLEPEEEVPAEVEEGQDERLRRSLVLLDVNLPAVALPDGVHCRAFTGNGVVVHHSATLGLVVTDRNMVSVPVGDITISFGAHPAEVPGRIRFLHPTHNFAILSYDPRDVPAEARSAIVPAIMDASPVRGGEHVALIGLNKSLRAMARASTVINACYPLNIAPVEVPRFRAVNQETVKLDQDFGVSFSGVLVSADDRLRALWASFSEQVSSEDREWCAGLQTGVFAPWVERLAAQGAGEPDLAAGLGVRLLDVELEPVLLSKAAHLGLPPAWVARMARLDHQRRQVLRVKSCIAGSHAREVLQDGDILLTVGGRPVTHFSAVDAAVAAALAAPPASSVQSAAGAPAARPSKAEVAAALDLACASSGSLAQMSEATCFEAAAAADEGTPPGGGVAARFAKRRRGIAGGAIVDALPTASDASTLEAVLSRCTQEAAAGQQGMPEAPVADEVALRVCRQGRVLAVTVRLAHEDGMGTSRLVHWCGAQIQAPHRAVREGGFLPENAGVFISRWHHGSPAHRYGLYALQFVQEVDGIPVPDLDAFVRALSSVGDGEFVRIKLTHQETMKSKVLSLKQDLKYWPTWELVLDPATSKWVRRSITSKL